MTIGVSATGDCFLSSLHDTRQLVLKPGRERSLKNRHPWVFTGAIAQARGSEHAATCEVVSATGERLGFGVYSPHSQIAGRVWSREAQFSNELLRGRIRAAIERRQFLRSNDTDIVRLIHSEGDDCSGLVVDLYNDVAVVEITSWGLDRFRETIAATLREMLSPRVIFFKNDVYARKLEHLSLEDESEGDGEPRTTARESGLTFVVDPHGGQKTGFFIDQRENRRLARSLARGRRVLNLFAYSGGFGVYAASGGAASVEEVDISADAIALARENHSLNRSENVTFTVADVFDYSRELVRSGQRFDLVVCDPPAFARSRGDVDRAARGYKDVNLQSIKLAAPGGLLLTFSCSGHMSLDLFQKVVYSAALDAGRSVSFVARLGAGADHPVSLYCPEGEYLKGFVLRMND